MRVVLWIIFGHYTDAIWIFGLDGHSDCNDLLCLFIDYSNGTVCC